MWSEFDRLTYGFCEGTIYGHPPEYINSFTSLPLTIVGLIALFASNNTHIVSKLFYASLTVSGIGSFGYHWTNSFGWRLIDEFSMIMISLSSLLSVTTCLVNKLVPFKRRSIVYNVMVLAIVLDLILTLVFDALDHVNIFRLQFGAFMFVVAIGVMCLIFLNRNIDRGILLYSYIGLILLVFSSSMWLTVELLCDNPNLYWIKYFPGHPLWHIGLSFGAYYLGQFIAYLIASDMGCQANFITDTWYRKLLPVVNYNSPLHSKY
jgi:hypothetical protein